MRARDVMVSPVITVQLRSSVKDVAELLWEQRISGAPVVDDLGKLVGIISEGDLVYRSEIGMERPHRFELAGEEALAAAYVKARARKVGDIMTRNVITASPDATISEIAASLESNSIKRIPIVEDGRIIGIVSRANLIQVIASAPSEMQITLTDTTIRTKLLQHLNEQRWAHTARLNVIVHDGVVELWGIAGSDAESQAIRVAAESMPGVRSVNDHLVMIKRDLTSR
jgi:CBS-domain-containing membrane protein